MPDRDPILKELGGLLGAISHMARLRIIEELGHGERDVNSLQGALRVSHSSVSQHLSVLRAHRVVAERREGRHVFYHLRNAALAAWLLDGMRFVSMDPAEAKEIRRAMERAHKAWSVANDAAKKRSPRNGRRSTEAR
ncbi:MAG TPA: metalloregulator ArsR/SmtB family transcription factor [Myxococcaceae bacterium]|nr:metalloregulator ArsR/SmtB family transcription factor [Myxococcaceae bacterium]